MKLPPAVREELDRVVGPREFEIFGNAMMVGVVDGNLDELCVRNDLACGCFYAHCGWSGKPSGRDGGFTELELYQLGEAEDERTAIRYGDTPYANTPGGDRLTAIWEYMLERADKDGWFQKGVFA